MPAQAPFDSLFARLCGFDDWHHYLHRQSFRFRRRAAAAYTNVRQSANASSRLDLNGMGSFSTPCRRAKAASMAAAVSQNQIGKGSFA